MSLHSDVNKQAVSLTSLSWTLSLANNLSTARSQAQFLTCTIQNTNPGELFGSKLSNDMMGRLLCFKLAGVRDKIHWPNGRALLAR